MSRIRPITPCLWFDDRAEEAARFYVSIFPDSAITRVVHTPQGAPGEPGSVLLVEFDLQGRPFTALNGGPTYTLTPAVSFEVDVETQDEFDDLWATLSDGGQEMQCGWLTDRFGVSWQVVPHLLTELLSGDPEQAARVTAAFMPMVKLDIETLRRAAEGP